MAAPTSSFWIPKINRVPRIRQQDDDQERDQEDPAEGQRVRRFSRSGPRIDSYRIRTRADSHLFPAGKLLSRMPYDRAVVMKAILLAGGKGTRLRPLTVHTPKPIVPIFNRPFLHYQIDLLRQVPEIDEVILSLNYQPRRIEEIFGEGEARRAPPLRRRADAAGHRRRRPICRRPAHRIGRRLQRRRVDAGRSGGRHRPAPRTRARRPPSC